jgi:hypothetical protein
VVIDGGGRVIDLTGSATGSPLITVDSGVTLTLKNITFKGIDNNTAPLIKVMTGGALVLDTGAVLTENKNPDSNGGGVSVEGGTLTMKAGPS